MPEGDTIARTADVLRSALVGGEIRSAEAQPQPGMRHVPDLSRLVGTRVTSVESRGKHLLVGFDSGVTLRTHLRMRGSWHRYVPGERWLRPRSSASVILETESAIAVAFSTPTVELVTDAALHRSTPLAALGPDLLATEFDTEEALRRLRLHDSRALGEALLDQRVVAGIGNVYKSEVAFLERLDPWAPVAAFDDAELTSAFATARRLMRANLRGGARVTTAGRSPGSALWVYGRSGRPCRQCGTLIASRRQGSLARLTYWCPRCQPDRGEEGIRPRSG